MLSVKYVLPLGVSIRNGSKIDMISMTGFFNYSQNVEKFHAKCWRPIPLTLPVDTDLLGTRESVIYLEILAPEVI